MATFHRAPYMCMKADQVIHPGHETPQQLQRRHYYAIASLLAMREKMAAACPEVRD